MMSSFSQTSSSDPGKLGAALTELLRFVYVADHLDTRKVFGQWFSLRFLAGVLGNYQLLSGFLFDEHFCFIKQMELTGYFLIY